VILGICFAYDKLKIVWAGYHANATTLDIGRLLLLSECYTMGMCNIGLILMGILCLGMNLKRLEGEI